MIQPRTQGILPPTYHGIITPPGPLPIAKKMTTCRFYRDPLRKEDFMMLINSHKIDILAHQI